MTELDATEFEESLLIGKIILGYYGSNSWILLSEGSNPWVSAVQGRHVLRGKGKERTTL